MGVTGAGRDQLEVVGDGVDTVCLVKCLRRKLGHADILKVEEVKEAGGAQDHRGPAAVLLPRLLLPPPPPAGAVVVTIETRRKQLVFVFI